MAETVSSPTGAPYVLCVGLSIEAAHAVARVAGPQAVVLTAPDTARVMALLGGATQPSSSEPEDDVIERGALRVDLRARQATWADALIELSAREFDLLATLAADAGRVWTFEELMARIWKTRYFGDSDVVVSAVKRLRRRLARVVDEIRVVSVRGIGFRLVVPD